MLLVFSASYKNVTQTLVEASQSQSIPVSNYFLIEFLLFYTFLRELLAALKWVYLVFTKVFIAELKDTFTRLKIFWQGLSSFNPQSRFPDHSAESTGRDCLDSAELSPWRTPLSIKKHKIIAAAHVKKLRQQILSQMKFNLFLNN